MIIYLDTNVYISAKYQFNSDKFADLRKFLAKGDMCVIYSSATIGEVEQHIREDVKEGVSKYNRLIRKELLPLANMPRFGLGEIDAEEAVKAIKEELSDFLLQDGVIKIDLNPIDAEELMNDYFCGNPPFESKKPYEFKDAIMAQAVKHYQKKVDELIFIVSRDKGFRKIFEKDKNFITVEFLGQLFRLYHKQLEQEIAPKCITSAIENGDFEVLLKYYFSSFDVDRDYYGEWECNKLQINEIKLELNYIEKVDDKYFVHFLAIVNLMAEISYLDEDTSYYDKEEQIYLIENYVVWRENHRVEADVVVACTVEKNSDDEYQITKSEVVDERKFHMFDLDESTIQNWDEIGTKYHELPDLIYCNECGKVIGYNSLFTDYDGNPLCSDCMVSDLYGDICPACNRKIPHELMNSGFCRDCFGKFG